MFGMAYTIQQSGDYDSLSCTLAMELLRHLIVELYPQSSIDENDKVPCIILHLTRCTIYHCIYHYIDHYIDHYILLNVTIHHGISLYDMT